MFIWNPYSPTGKSTATASKVAPPSPSAVYLESPRSSLGVSDCESMPSFCAAPVEPREYSCDAFDVFAKLRCAKKDAAIPNTLKRMPRRAKDALSHMLAATPPLVVDNCLEQRGNVVAAVLAISGAADAAAIVAAVTEHAVDIAVTKGGCIALCRVIDACSAALCAPLAAVLMGAFVELASDAFGNYVVQHLLRTVPEGPTRAWCLSAAAASLHDTGAMVRLACNKFGSHVLEVVLAELAAPEFLALLQHLIGCDAAVAFLARDDFANYAFQSALRRAIALDAGLRQPCFRAVAPHIATSRHARGLLRALNGTAAVEGAVIR